MSAANSKSAYRGSVVLSEDPTVAVIDDVLSAEEIAHLIDSASHQMQNATVSLDDRAAIIPGRSGANCWLRYQADPVVREIGERIAEIVGIPLSHAEAIQVIHYGPDQEYRAHHDAYDLSTARGQRCCRRGGQRLVTGLVYLNEVAEGGETAFPKLGVSVAPRPGRLLLFHNTGDDITVPHPGSLHAGMPVKRGEKWAFNIWFHARPMTELQLFGAAAVANPNASKRAQPPDGTQPNLIVNRAAQLWRRAFDNVGSELINAGACFTYWDTYGGSEPDLSSVERDARLIRLLDRKAANALANKASLARTIEAADLQHLAPPSYERVDDALQDNPPGTIWFIKPIFGTAGKGMYCVPANELSRHELPVNTILQKGVDNILLDVGRKFTTRLYVLVWNGEVRMFETGFTVTHGAPYQDGSTDRSVQIDHRGYLDEASPVQVRPGHKSDAFVGHFPAQRNLIRELRPILADCIDASDRDHYLLLGIDTLIRRDGTVQLIEINSFPNFIHTQEVNDEVNVPFFEAVIRMITGHPDPRLEVV